MRDYQLVRRRALNVQEGALITIFRHLLGLLSNSLYLRQFITTLIVKNEEITL
jgi:hypothetical protein